jgi:hypothetical protein
MNHLVHWAVVTCSQGLRFWSGGDPKIHAFCSETLAGYEDGQIGRWSAPRNEHEIVAV